MQILGLEKVIIMRFSGRKGDLEGGAGSNPDARDKEERQILFACKRRKKQTHNCDKIAIILKKHPKICVFQFFVVPLQAF